jgi:hypothetical protein
MTTNSTTSRPSTRRRGPAGASVDVMAEQSRPSVESPPQIPSPMGQRRSPAMRLTEPPMMTTPNTYDSKACDSTARRIRGSRTVVSDTW